MRWYRSIKIILGFGLGTMLAYMLNLDFHISAGIITILNLLDTKKASVNVAIRRFVSAFVGLFVMYTLFETLGYHLYVLLIFVAFITPLAFKFKAREGLIVNIVLASHLMVYSEVTFSHVINEFSLVVIGVIIGLLLSFHVPQKERKIKALMAEIDCMIKENLIAISLSIRNMCYIDEGNYNLEVLISRIKRAKKLAIEQMENYYSKDYSFYYEYFQLRLNQAHRINYMKEHVQQTFFNQGQASLLSDFTSKVVCVFDPLNDGKSLLVELENIKKTFLALPLPETQEAFLERASLYQYLNDLEEFINMKVRYMARNEESLLE